MRTAGGAVNAPATTSPSQSPIPSTSTSTPTPSTPSSNYSNNYSNSFTRSHTTRHALSLLSSALATTTTTTAASSTTTTTTTTPNSIPYAIVEVKNRPYHIYPNNIIVTGRQSRLTPGDIIALDRVREIGCRDYILKGNPYIHPSYFRITGCVLSGIVSQDISTTLKRRRTTDRVVVHRNKYTAIRIQGIEIKMSGVGDGSNN